MKSKKIEDGISCPQSDLPSLRKPHGLTAILGTTVVVGGLAAAGILFAGPANAWAVQASASTTCDANHVVLNGTFANNEPSKGINVTMQTAFGNDGPKLVAAGSSASFSVNTGQETLPAGTVTFDETWQSGQKGSDTKTAGFSAGDCTPATPPATPTAPTVIGGAKCVVIDGEAGTVNGHVDIPDVAGATYQDFINGIWANLPTGEVSQPPGDRQYRAVGADGTTVTGGPWTITIKYDGDSSKCTTTPPPPPKDVCSNIAGVQKTVPAGYTAKNGVCTKTVTPPAPPKDVCSNLSGVQKTVPNGYTAKNGVCTKTATHTAPPMQHSSTSTTPPSSTTTTAAPSAPAHTGQSNSLIGTWILAGLGVLGALGMAFRRRIVAFAAPVRQHFFGRRG